MIPLAQLFTGKVKTNWIHIVLSLFVQRETDFVASFGLL